MSKLLHLLRDPLLENINVDSTERLIAHRNILKKMKFLCNVFNDFHRTFRRLDDRYFTASGPRIELGAGIVPIRESYPDVLATDILYGQQLDRVLDAENMDLPDDSVRVFYGQNCFHHFPHPDRFFSELDRTLAPGGGTILIEPYYGPFAAFLYSRLFKTEGFDKEYPSWETPSSGPMNGANQALSYISFTRDKRKFQHKHPKLRIIHQELCRNHLVYLLSGGLNFRQLVPRWTASIIKLFQWTLSPLNPWISIHHVIVIRKE